MPTSDKININKLTNLNINFNLPLIFLDVSPDEVNKNLFPSPSFVLIAYDPISEAGELIDKLFNL